MTMYRMFSLVKVTQWTDGLKTKILIGEGQGHCKDAKATFNVTPTYLSYEDKKTFWLNSFNQ